MYIYIKYMQVYNKYYIKTTTGILFVSNLLLCQEVVDYNSKMENKIEKYHRKSASFLNEVKMEKVSLKRMRSEESPYILQTKMHVNEKIVESHDINKMKEIHAKTKRLLFQAARSVNNNNVQTNHNKKTPLSKLVVLLGNGQIESAKGADDEEDEFLWIRRKAKCCDRETYVQSDCINCQNPLCEECGFSCSECGQFICNTCVTIFGSGQADHPICENCSLFA